MNVISVASVLFAQDTYGDTNGVTLGRGLVNVNSVESVLVAQKT